MEATEDTGKRIYIKMADELTEKIIGSAIEVHKALGPGLLESIYEEALCDLTYGIFDCVLCGNLLKSVNRKVL